MLQNTLVHSSSLRRSKDLSSTKQLSRRHSSSQLSITSAPSAVNSAVSLTQRSDLWRSLFNSACSSHSSSIYPTNLQCGMTLRCLRPGSTWHLTRWTPHWWCRWFSSSIWSFRIASMLRLRWARSCSTSRSFCYAVSSSSRCGCGSMRTKSTTWLTSRTTSRETRRRMQMKWNSSSCSLCSCFSMARLLYTITSELLQSSQVQRIIRSDFHRTRVVSFWLFQECLLQ